MLMSTQRSLLTGLVSCDYGVDKFRRTGQQMVPRVLAQSDWKKVPLTLGRIRIFVPFGSLTDGMRPTPIRRGRLLRSVYMHPVKG